MNCGYCYSIDGWGEGSAEKRKSYEQRQKYVSFVHHKSVKIECSESLAFVDTSQLGIKRLENINMTIYDVITIIKSITTQLWYGTP